MKNRAMAPGLSLVVALLWVMAAIAPAGAKTTVSENRPFRVPPGAPNSQSDSPILDDQTFDDVPENSTEIGTLAFSDPDPEQSHQFNIIGGNGLGVFDIDELGTITVDPGNELDYEATESYLMDVEIVNAAQETDGATVMILLADVNEPPVVPPGQTFSIPENATNGTPVGAVSASDPENDPLTFSMDPGTPFEISIDGDLSVSNQALLDAETNPSVVFKVSASDGVNTGEANVTVNVTNSNEPPTSSAPQPFTVDEDAANTTRNVYDVFADPETADADLTYTIQSTSNPPLFSSVTLNKPTLTFDYAPNAFGSADVVVRAADPDGLFAEATYKVTVNPVNDAPVVTNGGIDDVQVGENAPDTNIPLGPVFQDLEDGDALTYAVTGNTTPNLFESVTIANATLTLNYKVNKPGSSQITVQATDTTGTPLRSVSTSFVVTVNAVNDPPQLNLGDINKTTNEEVTVTFTAQNFIDKFSDPDGDSLAEVRIDSLPDGGILKLNGSQVTISQVIPAASLGNLTYVPAKDWVGSTSFNWNASDGQFYAPTGAKVNITVQPVNDPPTLDDFGKTGQEGVLVLFQQADFNAAFHDAENDALQKVKIVTVPPNGVLRKGATTIIPGTVLNASDLNQLSFRPDDNWSGTTSFKWNGFDGTEYADTDATVTITIAPVNDAPTLDLNGGGNGTGFIADFVAGGPAVHITGSNLAIEDIDSDKMHSARAVITNIKHGTKEVLTADSSGTAITVGYSNGELTLAGEDTIANYMKVLRTVKFRIEPDVTNPDSTDRKVEFTVYDGNLQSNVAVATVRILNPRVEIIITPDFQDIIKGLPAVFHVVVNNTGDVNLTNIQVTSATVPDCTRSLADIAPGNSRNYDCAAPSVSQRIDNKVVVTAAAAGVGTVVTSDDTAIVRVPEDVGINITPDQTIVKGGTASFSVTVVNPSQTFRLRNVVVQAYVDYDVLVQNGMLPATPVPTPNCSSNVGELAAKAQKTYTCAVPNVQASFNIEVRVTAKIEGISDTSNFDIAKVTVLDMTLEAVSDPFEIAAGQPTPVEFNLTLNNASIVPLTLKSLASAVHGNLLAANSAIRNNTCRTMAPSIPAGGVRSCSYEVTLTAQPPAFINEITAVAAANQRQITVRDEALVSVSEFSPLEVILAADPPSLVAPGGDVNLTVQVRNNTSSDLTLDSLVDSVAGGLNGKGNCTIPATLVANGSYSCTYTVSIRNKQAGDVVKRTVTAFVDAQKESDTIDIPITAGPSVQLLLPIVGDGAVYGEPNNSICSAMTILSNQDYYFLPDDTNDWYRFTLERPSRVRIRLSNFMADGQIVVFTGTCTNPTLLKNNGNYEPLKEIDLGTSPVGTYFVWVVTDQSQSAPPPYVLRIEVLAP